MKGNVINFENKDSVYDPIADKDVMEMLKSYFSVEPFYITGMKKGSPLYPKFAPIFFTAAPSSHHTEVLRQRLITNPRWFSICQVVASAWAHKTVISKKNLTGLLPYPADVLFDWMIELSEMGAVNIVEQSGLRYYFASRNLVYRYIEIIVFLNDFFKAMNDEHSEIMETLKKKTVWIGAQGSYKHSHGILNHGIKV